MAVEIPEVVINRLPVYVRALAELSDDGETVVSSQELGQRLGVTPAQIRKDLSYFGRFGKQGRGYEIETLLGRLREILGLDRQWRICLVGVGRLGQAIMGYEDFAPQGFQIVAAFDSDLAQVGKRIGSITVLPTGELDGFLRKNQIDIGVVAVPASAAQDVVKQLVNGGVRAILNYAPLMPHVPRGVRMRHIDPVIAMQSMTFYLKDRPAAAK